MKGPKTRFVTFKLFINNPPPVLQSHLVILSTRIVVCEVAVQSLLHE